MFTGIVAAIGKITATKLYGVDADSGLHLSIDAGGLDLHDVALGDSIAINGACMTVVGKTAQGFEVDVSRESLRCTTGLDTIGEVNLEKALTLSERLGGHLVSGHVDAIGTVMGFDAIGESWLLVVQAPHSLAKYLACKGSVVVNGVSLTINRVEDTPQGCKFAINLIPHTVAMTTLKHLQPGVGVNLEVDLIARYVERMLSLRASPL